MKFPQYINYVELILTDYCPFHCKYCFVSHKENKELNMTMEIVDAVMHNFSSSTPPRIIFMGGEPLTRIDFIKEIIMKYKGLAYQVVTSGLINVSEFLTDIRPLSSNFDFQISWDGFHSSRENPKKVWNTIEEIVKAGNGVQVRCVISNENVKELFNIYKFLLEKRDKYPCLSFDFTIAYQKNVEESFPNILSKEFKKIFNYFIETNFKVYFPFTFAKYIVNFFNKKIKGFCGVGNYIAVRPNGDCYPCTSIASLGDFKYGNILDKSNLIISNEQLEKLRILPDSCFDCPIKTFCGGGCRYERILCGSLECNVEHRCSIMKNLYNIIKSSISQLNKEKLDILCYNVNKKVLWSFTYDNERKRGKYVFISSRKNL